MSEKNFDLKQTSTMSRFNGLLALLTGYRGLYLLAIATVGIAALARVGSYALIGYFVDDILATDKIGQRLLWIVGGLILLAIGQAVLTFIAGRWAAFVSEQATKRLRDFLYDHIQHLTFTYHDKQQTGELLQRATSDVDAIRRMFAEQGLGIGRISFVFVVNLIALMFINPRLALYSVASVPLIFLIAYRFFTMLATRYEAYQEQDAVVTNRLQENLSGVRVVKAFAQQTYEKDKFETVSREKYERSILLTRAHGFFWPTTDIICGLQTIFGYYIGAQMVLSETITIGAFVAAMGFIIQIIWPIRHLGRLIADSSTALVSFGRVAEIIKINREPLTIGTIEPIGVPTGQVAFEGVNFTYEGEPNQVLHDISFEVKAGQTVALLGSTGSGKTSLINLLTRFYEYTSGRILLDGQELNQIPRAYLRQHIGTVMQEPFLFAMSIKDNILYGVDAESVTDADIEAAARAAAVHDVILGFPDGYDTLVGERGVTLSGGQKQRVTLARTFLQNPAVLVLDDATSAVDTETESQIRSALQKLQANRTTFIIAHRIESVMHADLILVLDKGKIVQRGKHNELVAHDGIYQRIYNLQASIETDLQTELAELVYTNGHNGHSDPTTEETKNYV